MSNTEKKLLVIGYVWPEPASSAAGCHMLSLLRLFASQGWDIHYASPAQRTEHKTDLENESLTEHDIALNCSSFDDFVVKLAPDMVMFDRFMMEEQFGWRVAKNCPDAIRLLDTEDLHFLRHARHKALKQNRVAEESDLKGEQAQREIAAIYRCDLTLIISDYELRLLTETFRVPSELLCHCPFLLPDGQPDSVTEFEARQHFVSIGNFRHEPNWDAVLQLKQHIWPGIRKRLPKAEMHIYGAYPPPKATQLHKPEQGFLVKGWAEDAVSVIRSARVLLAPLRFGAGIKGKLTDAMLCGTPSVTTAIGAEGIQSDDRWPGCVALSDEEFESAAVNLYEQQSKWETASAYGFELLADRFDRQRIEQRVIQRIEEINGSLTQHRLNNFTGMMLQHHQHKSTQYFSQWIEAKNKS